MVLFHFALDNLCQLLPLVAAKTASRNFLNPTTLRELITDALLKGSNYRLLEKSTFLFGDRVKTSDEILYIDEHKWLREIDGVRIFLPDMVRSYPYYLFFRSSLILIKMSWNITKG